MNRIVPLLLVLAVGFGLGRLTENSRVLKAQGVAAEGIVEGQAADEPCVEFSGDVNADGRVQISDAVTILGYLFQGSPRSLRPLCESAEPTVGLGLPSTGQTVCFDTSGAAIDCSSERLAGQDGAYQAGCGFEGRFYRNADGTITDYCTGLMWQSAVGGGRQSWENALRYCEGLTLAGYDDWRLPNVNELMSLINYSRTRPAVDPQFFSTAQYPYWTSTTAPMRRDTAICVDLYVGWFAGRAKVDASGLNRHEVRAVRNVR